MQDSRFPDIGPSEQEETFSGYQTIKDFAYFRLSPIGSSELSLLGPSAEVGGPHTNQVLNKSCISRFGISTHSLSLN